MAETASTEPASIHMGHGQMVDIVARPDGRWNILFSEAGVEHYKAPPLKEVEADAIDGDGRIHPLAISAGDTDSSVIASGDVAGAYRVRMRVLHGDHFHTRESLLPGASPKAPVVGANGGSAATLDANSAVEVRWIDPTRWELLFVKDGAVVAPPAADHVVVQAIGPRAEDYQIRNLKTEPGSGPSSLTASGKIKDAVYARLTIKSAGGTETIRTIPIPAAA